MFWDQHKFAVVLLRQLIDPKDYTCDLQFPEANCPDKFSGNFLGAIWWRHRGGAG